MKSLVLTTLLAATRYIKIIKPFYEIKWKYALMFYVLEMSWILGSAIRESVMVSSSAYVCAVCVHSTEHEMILKLRTIFSNMI